MTKLFQLTEAARQDLRRKLHVPVSFHKAAPPLLGTPKYAALNRIRNDGFDFTVGALLHAIGTKVTGLPMTRKDDAVAAASVHLHHLDRQVNGLSYRSFKDSDLKANISQQVGIGMMALVASHVWGFDFDQLEAIAGRGKRMDYRARKSAVTAILEAKGTRYSTKQSEQIEDGLKKKKAHRKRHDGAKVELVFATMPKYRDGRSWSHRHRGSTF